MLQWMSIDVKENMKKNKNLQIIDVREPGEFAAGHIPGAVNIPLGQISSRYKEIDPNRETAVICLSGGRSSRACEFLQSVGYNHLHNVMGGMSSWDGPIER
ncbi:rhodanese-like domain-containing protein [Ferroacidibacillus organovorans]|uniref:Rhodanese domain-containing protein n=1 Tax=Ferroacidibacillus organovorans TaxID=1765683 RepID=A0A101XQA3_9BACL|nr:rhodanese-like domain-containing protein [Ferroacidibacillus organovorans]KUO95531.1 hypothetical protein ATW55_06480 [Ferroacidibacillus organovorans]